MGGGGICAHKIQIYCKDKVIKTVWYQCREIQMDQKNRIENQEKDSCLCGI